MYICSFFSSYIHIPYTHIHIHILRKRKKFSQVSGEQYETSVFPIASITSRNLIGDHEAVDIH